MRLLIIGALEGQLTEATKLAMQGGAKVAHASSIDLPEGAEMQGSEIAGDRLIVRVALPDHGVEFLLFDLRNGTRVGAIEIRRPSAAAEAEAKP